MFPAERNPRTERVEFELRTTGVRPEAANPLRSGVHTRGYLPHVKREGARYFVTFRLADSLPTDVLLKYQAERAKGRQRFYAQAEAAQKLGTPPPDAEILDRIDREFFRKLDSFLDRNGGECW